MKTCSRCKDNKPIEHYCKYSRAKDKLNPWCNSCRKEYKKKWVSENSSKVVEDNKTWYQSNKHHRLQVAKRYYEANDSIIKSSNCAWRHKNRSRVNAHAYASHKRRMLTSANYRLKVLVRKRIYCAIKSGKDGARTTDLLGCSIPELRLHLERQFQPGMTWDNWSVHGWHIDHVLPLDSFTLSEPEQLKKACHYTNLQPLWARDNLVKSNKLIEEAANG